MHYYLGGNGSGKIQSLIAGAILAIATIILFAIGILADLNAVNRKITEEILYLKRKEVYGPSRIVPNNTADEDGNDEK